MNRLLSCLGALVFVAVVVAVLCHTRYTLAVCPGDAVGAYRLDRWTGQVRAYGDATVEFKLCDEPIRFTIDEIDRPAPTHATPRP